MPQVEKRESVILENHGEKIFCVLHRPLTNKPCPAVLICPGFAGNKTGKFRIFVNLAKALAQQGIAVFRFDYRGSGDSEGEFQELTIDGKVSDTLTCLDFLSLDSQIDPKRIGILGRSLGGAIAVLAAGKFHTIKSLALWAPVFKSDPWKQLWELFQSNKMLAEQKQDILLKIPNLDFLSQFFALDLKRELHALKNIPLLHIQGELDMIVKMEHAIEFENAREGIEESRFIRLPKSDHEFSDPKEQEIAVQETIQWFRNTLKKRDIE